MVRGERKTELDLIKVFTLLLWLPKHNRVAYELSVSHATAEVQNDKEELKCWVEMCFFSLIPAANLNKAIITGGLERCSAADRDSSQHFELKSDIGKQLFKTLKSNLRKGTHHPLNLSLMSLLSITQYP